MLCVNDKCSVTLDWGEDDLRGKRVQIIREQQHGDETFFKVLWRCRDASTMQAKYGNLFTAKELKKVS